MARFCTQCGRRLEEGEVCNCTQQNAGAAGQQQGPSGQQQSSSGQQQGPSGQQGGGSGAGTQGSPYTYSQGTYQNQGASQGQGTYQNQGASQGQGTYQNQGGPQGQWQQQFQRAGMNSQQMRQMGAQAMAGARNMFQEILPILRHPVTRTQRIAAGNSPMVGLELIGLKALVILIIILLIASRIGGAAGGMIQIPYFKLILLTLILTVGLDALEAVLMNAFAGLFRGRTNINAMFCVVGTRALYDGIIALVAGLLAPFFITGSLLVLGLGGLILPFLQYGAYRAAVPGDEDRKIYAFFLVKVISAVVMYVLFYLMAADMLTTLAGGLMGNIMGGGYGGSMPSGF